MMSSRYDVRRIFDAMMWILIYSMLIGGRPWIFPNRGKGLLEMSRIPPLELTESSQRESSSE